MDVKDFDVVRDMAEWTVQSSGTRYVDTPVGRYAIVCEKVKGLWEAVHWEIGASPAKVIGSRMIGFVPGQDSVEELLEECKDHARNLLATWRLSNPDFEPVKSVDPRITAAEIKRKADRKELRTRIATAAMQGILSDASSSDPEQIDKITRVAVQYADVLIAKLEQG